MTDNEKLHALIQRVFGELGGRADDEQIVEAVVAAMTEVDRGETLRAFVKSKVSGALRVKNDGLAMAQNINGTWTQLTLMDIDEYRYCARSHSKLSKAHRAIAERYVDRCQKVYGVDISDELAIAS